MPTSLNTWLKKNGILLAIFFIIVVIIGNFSLYCYNRMTLLESMQARQNVEDVKKKLEFLWAQVQISDMGVRGYLLVPEELMAVPLLEAFERYPKGFEELEHQLAKQGFDGSALDSFKKLYVAKMEEALHMKKLKQQGKGEQALEIFKKDSGYQLWLLFTPLQEKILSFEKAIKDKADARYEQSLTNTLVIQVILLVLSIPILGLVIYQLLQNEWQKKALFHQVTESNNRYLFCETEQQEKVEEQKVITRLVANLQKASGFIQEIAKGNYGVQWQGLNEQNERLNNDTLSGHLLNMREQMKKVKEEEQKRLWATEGFAKFADLLRLHNDNLETTVLLFLSELIKYIKANQGAVFVATESDKGEGVLEMKACYAYGKKKFIGQTVHPGEGLVGQAFQEKEKIYLTEVPANYIKISSGLGEERPRCLLIIPLKNNEQVVGVIELASFQTLADYQIQFIEKVAENLSGSLVTAQVNARTKFLLQESLQTAEQMRAQEEEMRQNMEELSATQEEMLRSKNEIEQLLKESQKKEAMLKEQEKMMQGSLEEITMMQQELQEKDKRQVQEIQALKLSYQAKEKQMQEIMLEMQINEQDMQKNEDRYRKLLITCQTLQLEIEENTSHIKQLEEENAELKTNKH